MAKYRIVKRAEGSSRPILIWMDKASDADAVAAATVLLARGESADVWSETALVKQVQRNATRGESLRIGNLLAGAVMAISVASLLMVVHDSGLSSAASPVKALSLPADAVADKQPVASSDNLPVRVSDAAAPVEVASSPSEQPPATAISKAHRVRGAKPRIASAPVPPRATLFPAVPQGHTNVYGLIGSGFAQGGN